MPLFPGKQSIFFQPGINDFHIGSHDRGTAFSIGHPEVPVVLIRIFFSGSPVDTNPIGDLLNG
ncbi:hypothetical protein, partial [Paenibacillus sp. EPM92]|uniref:hypothetical protein n=1 Tax=Paenibacillus sp. EPM92 TaxID=1561195 RepID=UPI001F443FD3